MSRSVTLRRLATFALVSCACLAPADPIIAQSGSALDRARVSFTSVHQYVAAEAIPRQLAPPPNLVVSSMYRPLVESMLRQSPTFRRQCVRIAAERSLTVHLAITKPSPGYDVRATTRITRDEKGHLSAAIQITPLHDVEELIAHEFEHIIEQLDGVDLGAHAAQRHTGVTAIGYGRDIFETMRAKRAGLKVVSELGR
jgi:hypothetical protein